MKKILVGLALVSTIGFANEALCKATLNESIAYGVVSTEALEVGDKRGYCIGMGISLDYARDALNIYCKHNYEIKKTLKSYIQVSTIRFNQVCE